MELVVVLINLSHCDFHTSGHQPHEECRGFKVMELLGVWEGKNRQEVLGWAYTIDGLRGLLLVPGPRD